MGLNSTGNRHHPFLFPDATLSLVLFMAYCKACSKC